MVLLEVYDLLARAGVAAVFWIAAAAKLRDPDTTAHELRAPGTWAPLSRFAWPLALALPVAELLLAVTLLLRPTAWPAAIASVLLLAAFTTFLVAQRRAGRDGGCACFGAGRTSQRTAILRDAGMIAALLPVIALPGLDRHALPLSGLGLAGAVAAVTAGAVFAFLGRDGEPARGRRAVGSPPAAPAELTGRRPAPPVSLPATSGGTTGLAQPGDPRPVLVAFVDAGCEPCERILPRLAQAQRSGYAPFRVLVVGGGDPPTLTALAAEHGVTIGLDPAGAVGDAYGVTATPSAFLVGPDGTTAARPAVGEDALAGLLSGST